VRLDGATFLVQWAVGGLAFCWVTTRRREVGIGYGWLLRGLYAVFAVGGVAIMAARGVEGLARLVALLASVGVVAGALVALGASIRHRTLGTFDPRLDVVAPVCGVVALVAASVFAGGAVVLAGSRLLVGAAFLGAISDAMLLGHWYLVQPGLRRDPLRELVRWNSWLWPAELAVMLWPTGMISVLNGTIDDGYNGLLGWVWVACALTTIALVGVTWLALRERYYSAVMSATGLLYLAILTAFGTDLIARAALA
jgi:hypothetical protein